MHSENKELVRCGRAFADALSHETSIVEVEQMIYKLVNKLDVTNAALGAALKERDAVVAENASLKQSIDEIAEAMETGTDGALFTAIDEAISLCTPATESVLARIQAQGVDMAISKLESSKYGDEGDLIVLRKFAAELRKGAAV